MTSVVRTVEFLTADTERGHDAIAAVMRHSYAADLDSVPPQWALARVVDGVPVSFVVVDPDRWIELPTRDLRYAFVSDVATRADRRREGHFPAIMEHVFACVRSAGISLVITHGRHQLYRQFGFGVFTHHRGIFATPELIERELGTRVAEEARNLLVIEDRVSFLDDLLVVTDVRAASVNEGKTALQAAAVIARERSKSRILFEDPPAPSYGSRYPVYASPETALTAVARACGAQVCLQRADPESGSIPDADWIKVLDAPAFVREGLECQAVPPLGLPEGMICLETDAGAVTIESSGGAVMASDGMDRGAHVVRCHSSLLAQLVTGYQTAQVLCAIHGVDVPGAALALLGALFPPRWRISRNESWTYKG